MMAVQSKGCKPARPHTWPTHTHTLQQSHKCCTGYQSVHNTAQQKCHLCWIQGFFFSLSQPLHCPDIWWQLSGSHFHKQQRGEWGQRDESVMETEWEMKKSSERERETVREILCGWFWAERKDAPLWDSVWTVAASEEIRYEPCCLLPSVETVTPGNSCSTTVPDQIPEPQSTHRTPTNLSALKTSSICTQTVLLMFTC